MLPVSLAPVEGTWLGPVSALFYHTPSNNHHITLFSFFPYHLNWFCLWIFCWVHLFPNPLFLAVGSALWELFSLFHEKWFLFDANFSVCFLLMERWVPRGLFLKKKKKLFLYLWLHQVLVVVYRLLSSYGVRTPESTGSVAEVNGFSHLAAAGILVPWPGTEPMSPALEGEFLTTGPPEVLPSPRDLSLSILNIVFPLAQVCTIPLKLLRMFCILNYNLLH